LVSLELKKSISDAQHRIEELYNETNGKCYLSFSGGKDSMVILALIKMCEQEYTIPKDSIQAVFCDTGVEMLATINFIQWVKDNYYDNVETIKTKLSMLYILDTYGRPLKSKFKSDLIHDWQSNGNTNTAGYKGLMATNEKSYTAKFKIGDKSLHIMSPDFDIMVSANKRLYARRTYG
jgi:hypothetical protein